jgi:Ca2+-binding EF-hand superfamily protein
MPSPTAAAPHIWTPRQSHRYFKKSAKLRSFKPQGEAPLGAYSPPAVVPIRGTFAGLQNVRKAAPAITVVTKLSSSELIAEAEALEDDKKPRKQGVAVQLRELLAEANVDVPAQLRAWDPTNSGSVLKTEFRLRIKALFAKHRPKEPFDIETKEIDAFFDSHDKDKSGVISSNELKTILVDLKCVAVAIQREQAEVRKLQSAKATRLREIAVIAAEGEGLEEDANRREAELTRLKREMEADLEVQLGIACTRRRIKAADFVGQFASSSEGLTKGDFVNMVSGLLLDASARMQAAELFHVIDVDGSGRLDAKECTAALKAMQKKGDELRHERDAQTTGMKRCRSKAATKARIVRQQYAELQGYVQPSMLLLEITVDEMTPPSSPEGDMSDSSRARKERAERIHEIGRQALRRLPQQQLAKGWNSWLLFVESRARNLLLLQASVGHVLHRKLAGGFNNCVDYWLTSREMVQMLSEGVAKFKYRKANSAFNAWQYATGTGEYAPSLLSACMRSPRRLSPHRYGRVCSFPLERRQAELVDVWPCPAGILV